MKKIMVVLLAGMFLMTGCFEVYKIEPDGSQEKVEISLGNEEESGSGNGTTTNENSGSEESGSETDTEEEASTDTENDSETSDETDVVEDEIEEDTENDEANAYVEQYFVTQFSNDEAYDLEVDVNELSNELQSWSFKRNSEHEQVTGYYDIDISLFDTYFINNAAADEKVIYLTFDEGYEQGYTGQILDVLKANNVKATFFITGYYLRSQPELVQRMVDEGHIVGNHTDGHPKLPEITDEEIYEEITSLADDFKDLTGQEMDPFFRPPSGAYSEKTLYLTRKLGYRTIFWSMAYKDYLVDDQPGKEAAYEHVMTNYHNGAVILLHAVSESNTEALDDILKDLLAEGYRFGSLYELD